MCPSPTESPDDNYDSYTKAGRGRRAEGRSSSPKPRKSDEWGGWNTWDRPERRREDSRRRGSRSAPAGHNLSKARAPEIVLTREGYMDSQRDVNEGTINVLRSIHAKLMSDGQE
jgi:hypothetical protein